MLDEEVEQRLGQWLKLIWSPTYCGISKTILAYIAKDAPVAAKRFGRKSS